VYTDEIYEYFTYDNKKHISPSSLKDFKENTITISGFSKTFSITGWRVGYCIVPKKYFKLIGHLSDLIYVCSPSILQYAVAQGLKKIEFEFYENISKNFKNKRDLLCSTLEKIGISPIIPDGSYYVLSNVSKMKGNSSKEKALEILRQTNVASVPGSSFYNSKTGENFVRFCFANEDKTLKKACQNLLKLKL
jgi:aminotransferase